MPRDDFRRVTTDCCAGAWPEAGALEPIAATLGLCAVAFFAAPGLPNAWAVVITLGAMAFFVDMHNPSIWSFAQDVGGKKGRAALGWNMWGQPRRSTVASGAQHDPVRGGWNAAFVFCGFAFVAAAVCGLLLDATKPVDAEDA